MVIKQMELADVKPDSQTFSYLICNCDREEDIVKVSFLTCCQIKYKPFYHIVLIFIFLVFIQFSCPKACCEFVSHKIHVSFFFIVKNWRASTDLSQPLTHVHTKKPKAKTKTKVLNLLFQYHVVVNFLVVKFGTHQRVQFTVFYTTKIT